MDDTTLAKDLLLGKNQVQMKRFKNSACVKFFMRPSSKSRRKDVKYLKTLAKFLARDNTHKIDIYDLNLPGGEQSDYIVLELTFNNIYSSTAEHDADTAEARWEQYKEVAFGGI
jgi:hypothetical protein